jgi:MFS family permease
MYHGWLIVTGVFVAQLFTLGFFTYAFGLLVVPVQAEFGASRSEVMASMTGAGIVGLFIAPIVGTLVDRWSVRGLMIIGSLVFTAALLLLSLSRSVVDFVLVFALLISVANMLLGPVTCSAVVSRWFTTSRGKALGVAAIGASVGGMLVPMLLQHSASCCFRSC